MIRVAGSDHTQLYREVWLRVLLALDSADETFRAEVASEVIAAAPPSWDVDLELAEDVKRIIDQGGCVMTIDVRCRACGHALCRGECSECPSCRR